MFRGIKKRLTQHVQLNHKDKSSEKRDGNVEWEYSRFSYFQWWKETTRLHKYCTVLRSPTSPTSPDFILGVEYN